MRASGARTAEAEEAAEWRVSAGCRAAGGEPCALIEAVRKEEQAAIEEADAARAHLPDDNDDVDEAAEYEAWKLRAAARAAGT